MKTAGIAGAAAMARLAAADEHPTGPPQPGSGAANAQTAAAMSPQAEDVADVPAGELSTPTTTREGDMQFRVLGQTGAKVSIVGIGGFHMAKPDDKEESTRIVRTAVDAGINFMDNCWDYHDGESERRMGAALQNGYRDKVFLMTKIDGRTKVEAARQIDESLKRLQTDHVDLLQHHEILRLEDPDRVFAEGGANEAVVAAQKAGKVRFIGFTGHKDPLVHRRMLEMADRHNFRFDTAQMPINALDAHFRSFIHQVVPILVKRQMGVLGMKPLASGIALRTGKVEAVEMLHFAMTMPTSVVITGCDSLKIVQQAINAARTFKPLTKEQIADLLARTREPAAKGRFEPFKTGTEFDSTAKNPQWLG